MIMANFPVNSTHPTTFMNNTTLLNNTYFNNTTMLNNTLDNSTTLLQQHSESVVDGSIQFNGWLIFVGVAGTPFGLYVMEMIILAITMFKIYAVVRVWTVANTLAHIRKFIH